MSATATLKRGVKGTRSSPGLPWDPRTPQNTLRLFLPKEAVFQRHAMPIAPPSQADFQHYRHFWNFAVLVQKRPVLPPKAGAPSGRSASPSPAAPRRRGFATRAPSMGTTNKSAVWGVNVVSFLLSTIPLIREQSGCSNQTCGLLFPKLLGRQPGSRKPPLPASHVNCPAVSHAAEPFQEHFFSSRS